MIKSKVLCELLRATLSEEKPRVYHDKNAEKIDDFVSQSDIYSDEYKETTRRYALLTGHDLQNLCLGMNTQQLLVMLFSSL